MEIKKPIKPIGDWTLKELQVFCKNLVGDDGPCPAHGPKDCPFYNSCDGYPGGNWLLEESPNITAREREILSAFSDLKIKSVGVTGYSVPFWVDGQGNKIRLPKGIFPSIGPRQEFDVLALLGEKIEQ